MTAYIRDIRSRYPDLLYEVNQLGLSDNNHLFIMFSFTGTNMEAPAGSVPSYHESHVGGIAMLTFNDDRSKLLEVCEYRQPTLEEKNEVLERAQPTNIFSMKLARLHWEPEERKTGL